MKKKTGSRIKASRASRTLFLMAFPCIVYIFIFSYLPLKGWIYAIFNYKPGFNLWDCEFVGMKNFTTMFGNAVLRKQLVGVLRNTFAMAGLNILFSPLPVLFAIFLNEMNSSKVRRTVQTIATFPHFISWVIMYSLVFFMFSTNGLTNSLMISLGLRETPVNYLVSTKHVWLTMKTYQIWKGLGWSAIVYLAAISGIDQQLYEAATIDGAGRFRRMWHITVPGVIPTYFVLLIIGFGHFLSVGFEQFYIFQNAMNKEYIEVLELYVYNQGIASGNTSYATAVGIMKSVVAIVLFTFANSLSKIVRGSSIF